MFTIEEHNFLIKALDEAVKSGGLSVAGRGLAIAMKLQQMQAEAAEAAQPAPPLSLPERSNKANSAAA